MSRLERAKIGASAKKYEKGERKGGKHWEERKRLHANPTILKNPGALSIRPKIPV